MEEDKPITEQDIRDTLEAVYRLGGEPYVDLWLHNERRRLIGALRAIARKGHR